ncbi:hypothetical protein ABIA39_004095 [Nocardia sp. GAS34]
MAGADRCDGLVRAAAPPRSATTLPCLIVLAVVAAASFTISLIWAGTQPPWAFFSLPSRAWELAAGGMVALSALVWSRLPKSVAVLAGWIGLVLIVAACVHLNGRTQYPGTAALLPVAGAALVIVSGCAETRFGVGRVLAPAQVRAIGGLSYTWYLWHWPVLLLAPYALGRPLDRVGALGAVVLAGGLAMLTRWWVENPIRFAAPLRRSATLSLACGGACTAVALCVALALLMLVPAPVGHGSAARSLTLMRSPAPVAPVVDPSDEAVSQLMTQTQSAVAASAEIRAVPSNLTPSLDIASGDKADVFTNGCVRSWREVGQAECASGDLHSATRLALVGDSHAGMWNPAFESIAAARGWRLETMAKVTCPLLDLPITSPYLGREYTECEQWRGQVLSRLRAERPRLIVVDMSRRYGGDFGFVSYDAWIDALTRLVAQLRVIGSAVLVLGSVPDPHTTVPTCLSEHIDDASACSPTRQVAVNDAGIAAEQAATMAGGGQFDDLTSLFCTAVRCPVIVGNTLVFRDDNHLTVSLCPDARTGHRRTHRPRARP